MGSKLFIRMSYKQHTSLTDALNYVLFKNGGITAQLIKNALLQQRQGWSSYTP